MFSLADVNEQRSDWLDHGQWIDEVFQHTIPMPPQKSRSKKVVDGDIHQAGYHTRSDLDKREMTARRWAKR